MLIFRCSFSADDIFERFCHILTMLPFYHVKLVLFNVAPVWQGRFGFAVIINIFDVPSRFY